MPATLEAPEQVETPSPREEAKAAFEATLAAALTRGSGDVDDSPAEEEIKPADAPTDEVQVAADTSSPAEPESPKAAPAGPSRDWVQFAMEENVPPELIGMARDDKQLEEMVLKFGDHAMGVTAEPAVVEPAIKLPIPEDEFDATDPAHRALKEVVEQSNKTISELKAEFDSLKRQTREAAEAEQTKIRIAESEEFNKVFDELKIGAPFSPERHAAFAVYDTLKKAQPSLTREEAMRRAAYTVQPDLLSKQARDAQLAALKEQSQQTLGGGPAKPAPKTELSPRDKFLTLLKEKNRKALEAGR
jgi:hypothetical protein